MSAPRYRAAGVIAPQVQASMPRLPMAARFDSDVWGDAFWFARAPGALVGELFISSGSRIVRDVLSDLGRPTGQSLRHWSRGLLELLHERVISLGGQVPSEYPDAFGSSSGLEWMRCALWATYHSQAYPRTVTSVAFPDTIRLPPFGEVMGLGDQPTRALSDFRPSMYSPNPFGVTIDRGARPVQGENTDVTGGGFGGKKAGAGGEFPVAAAALAVAAVLAISAKDD